MEAVPPPPLGKLNLLKDVIFRTNINSVFQMTSDVLVGALGKLDIEVYIPQFTK